jgi:hypothetical protein
MVHDLEGLRRAPGPLWAGLEPMELPARLLEPTGPGREALMVPAVSLPAHAPAHGVAAERDPVGPGGIVTDAVRRRIPRSRVICLAGWSFRAATATACCLTSSPYRGPSTVFSPHGFIVGDRPFALSDI